MSSDADVVEVEVTVDAPPEAVWEAFTTGDGLSPWMGEGSQLEPQVDGQVGSPDIVSGRPRQGRVERVDVDRKLEFVWWPEDDPQDLSKVSIVLEPVPAGTSIRVVERRPQACATLGRSFALAAECGLEWEWRLALIGLWVAACTAT